MQKQGIKFWNLKLHNRIYHSGMPALLSSFYEVPIYSLLINKYYFFSYFECIKLKESTNIRLVNLNKPNTTKLLDTS